MRPLIFVSLGLCALGQDVTPIGFVRGELVSWTGSSTRGELTIRSTTHLYSCNFDPKTYFERDDQRIAPAAMSTGDKLEVLADHKPGTQICYARTVQLIDPVVVHTVPGVRPVPRTTYHSTTELFAPRGDMTFSGIVVRMDPGLLTLRTRSDGRKLIVLRQDTRYVGNGIRVDAASLIPSTQVFIRAGKNFDNQIEAYQVIWGEMLDPR